MSELSCTCDRCGKTVERELMEKGYDLIELSEIMEGQYVRDPIQLCYTCQRWFSDQVDLDSGSFKSNAGFYESGEKEGVSRAEIIDAFGDAYYGADCE